MFTVSTTRIVPALAKTLGACLFVRDATLAEAFDIAAALVVVASVAAVPIALRVAGTWGWLVLEDKFPVGSWKGGRHVLTRG